MILPPPPLAVLIVRPRAECAKITYSSMRVQIAQVSITHKVGCNKLIDQVSPGSDFNLMIKTELLVLCKNVTEATWNYKSGRHSAL